MPKKYSIDVVLIIANFYLSEKELLVSMLDKSDDYLPFPFTSCYLYSPLYC